MTIKAIELIVLITLSTWVGLYLLIRQYGGSAEKLAGTIYLCYGAYLLLRAVAKTSAEPAFALLLARFAYVPSIIALVSLCRLACLFSPVKHNTKRIVLSVIIVASLVMGTLAVGTPLILQRIVYVSGGGWPDTENGPAFWVWLVYISTLIGLSLYCFARTWLANGIRRPINSGSSTQNSLRKFAGVALVVIVSGFLNHIGKSYEDSFSIGPSIFFVLGTIYLAYMLVTTFDRAFRSPMRSKGMSFSILMDTLMILTGTFLFIVIARVINQESLSLSAIFLIDFWASGLAAGLAGTRHRLYATFRHEIRRMSRQNRQFNVLEPAPAQSLVVSPATLGGIAPQPNPETPNVPNEIAKTTQSCADQEVTDSAATDNEQLVEDNSSDLQLYRELRLALRSLHDPARLGALHSLACGLPGDTAWQRGEALQQQLIQAIQRLEPHGDESYANQWQHYQILWRLYCEGQSRLDIMQALSLSERHYQRHLHDALVVFVAQWQNSGKN